MKFLLPVVIVLILVVVAGGFYFLNTKSTQETNDTAKKTSEGLSQIASQAETQVKCSASTILVKEVKYPSGSGSGVIDVSILYSSGTESLSDMFLIVLSTGSKSSDSLPGTILPGQQRTIRITANYPPDSVKISTLCQNSVAVIGECVSGQPCMRPV